MTGAGRHALVTAEPGGKFGLYVEKDSGLESPLPFYNTMHSTPEILAVDFEIAQPPRSRCTSAAPGQTSPVSLAALDRADFVNHTEGGEFRAT